MKHYKNKSTGEIKALYKTISNGNILTDMSEDTGRPICNDCLQSFVCDIELTSMWEPYAFKVKTDADETTKKALRTLVFELIKAIRVYGLTDGNLQHFESVEYKINLIARVIFDDSLQTIKGVDTLVNSAIKQQYPEEVADEYIYTNQDVMYYILFLMRNSIRSFINDIKETKENNESNSRI